MDVRIRIACRLYERTQALEGLRRHLGDTPELLAACRRVWARRPELLTGEAPEVLALEGSRHAERTAVALHAWPHHAIE